MITFNDRRRTLHYYIRKSVKIDPHIALGDSNNKSGPATAAAADVARVLITLLVDEGVSTGFSPFD